MDFTSNSTSGIETIFGFASSATTSFLDSGFFLALKIFLIAYVLLLIADLVMMLMLKGVGGDIRKGMRGMDIPTTSKTKMQRQWDKVKKRLESGDMSQYKVAIIEADAVADKLLEGIGYKGNNMAERLAQIKPEQLDYYTDELSQVHEIRNRIVHEEDFSVDKETAEGVVKVYERFLRYLEYL